MITEFFDVVKLCKATIAIKEMKERKGAQPRNAVVANSAYQSVDLKTPDSRNF